MILLLSNVCRGFLRLIFWVQHMPTSWRPAWQSSNFSTHLLNPGTLVLTMSTSKFSNYWNTLGVPEWFAVLSCDTYIHEFELPTMLVDTGSTRMWILKKLAAVMNSVQSTGVTPEMNLRYIQARKRASKGSTLSLKPSVDVSRSLKQEYSISGPTKTTCLH